LQVSRIVQGILVVIIGIFIGTFFLISDRSEQTLNTAILETTQAANTTVTKLFINQVYPNLESELQLRAGNVANQVALSGEALNTTDRAVRNFMLGTDILKVKIYNIKGLTLYSTDHSQIGDDKSGNDAFKSAIRGNAGSQITHRGKFSALEGELFERDLVASYIPIRNTKEVIIGVAELYTDRTPVIQLAQERLISIQSLLLILLTTLIVMIAALVWVFSTQLIAKDLELMNSSQ
jgi:hypothetical protein